MYFFKYIFNVKRKAEPSDIVQFANLLFYILKTKFRRKNFEDIHLMTSGFTASWTSYDTALL